MKRIELKIAPDGYIICTYIKGDKTRYIDYKNILNELYTLSKSPQKLSIINNKIGFSIDDNIVIIENYTNNRDKKLQIIIEKLKLEKIKRRKKELRKKKIKRTQMITASLLLSAVTITTSLIGNNIGSATNKEELEDDNFIAYEEIETKKTQRINGKKEIIFEEENNFFKTESNEKVNIQHNEDIAVEFEDRTNTEKYRITKAYYEGIISKISKKYGIDPKIMLAIATQESGMHKINENTPAIGLMQIEKSVWIGETLTAYNYETGTYESINITKKALEDLEINIKVACMYFQKCLKDSKYNLALAIQMYNYGYGNIDNTLKKAYNGNIDLKNIEKLKDNEWLQYREDIKAGDNLYLEHILSYIEDLDNIEIKTQNETKTYSVSNTNEIRHKI